MHQPRAPSSPPLPHHTHHHHQEQTVYRSSSSPAATSPARPEEHSGDTMQHQAGHRRDNDVPPWRLARDIVRGVVEEVRGPHPQTHRDDRPNCPHQVFGYRPCLRFAGHDAEHVAGFSDYSPAVTHAHAH